MKEKALVELSHCSLVLGAHKVLDDVSFTVRRGERWAVLGPNGAGKTLLLKMLRGDVWPTPTGRESRIYAFDGEVSSQPRDLKQRFAYVGPERQDKYERYGWNLRVEQVVTTGLFDEDLPLSTPSRAQQAHVQRVLERFELWGLRRRRMLTLSYGQRRLALIARAFASPADVLLLDEAFSGLDERTKRKLCDALERPRGRHAWVLTSHRAHELPRTLTHLARIAAGKITSQGPIRTGGMTRTADDHAASSRAARPDAGARASNCSSAAWLLRIAGADVYREHRSVVRSLNWTIRRGEHWAVLGANGAGKSTLLSLIYGDLHPALGGIVERAGFHRGERIEEWKRRVGWLSPELQAAHHRARSLEEIVISGRYASVGLNEPPTRADRIAARRWLKYFGLGALRDRGPRQVSYGQLRLALLARAMVNDPELLLLDEPCAGLDGEVRAHVLHVLHQLASKGTQLIVAVHDQEDLPHAITHVLHIKGGGRVDQRMFGAAAGGLARSASDDSPVSSQ